MTVENGVLVSLTGCRAQNVGILMQQAKYYREKAEIMLLLRDTALDPRMKVDYERIARQWDQLAVQAEIDEKIANELEHLREMWNVK